MKTSVLPLAVLCVLAAAPAVAQQRAGATTTTTTLTQQQIAPMEDVVVATEQRLQQLGYNVTPDGQFDANTRNNVLRFQSNAGLRPTGNIDLETLAALGIDVDASGRVAMTSRQSGQQMAMAEQTAATTRPVPRYNIPLFRDEHMDSPQVRHEGGRFENYTGVPQPYDPGSFVAHAPGIPPGYPIEDLYD